MDGSCSVILSEAKDLDHGPEILRFAQDDRAGLLEDAEVSEQPPQQNEDQDGAEAAAAEFLRAIARGDTAQEFAHRCALIW
jgi:hypothetical protein